MSIFRLCAAVLLLCGAAHADDIREISLKANDLVYDRVSGRLYASVPGSVGPAGNSITPIDPLAGRAETPIWVGSEPNRLALSDDGTHLYVGLSGAAAVRRVHLPSRTAELQVSLGRDLFGAPYLPHDLAVLPGQPRSIAVSRRSQYGSGEAVAIFDDGVPRPSTGTRLDTADSIAFSDSATRLYAVSGYDGTVRRMNVSSSGVSVADVTRALIVRLGGGVEFDGGILYTPRGSAVLPEALKTQGSFPINGWVSSVVVEPDRANRRVFFLVRESPYAPHGTLLAFDAGTFTLVGSQEIPGVEGDLRSLVRWGEEGLAFLTTAGQVFLVRSSLVRPPANRTDLSLAVQEWPDPAFVGGDLTYRVIATNRGAAAATGVILTQTLSPELSFVSAVSTQGACSQSGGVVTCAVGTVAPGASVAVTVLVRPSRGGVGTSATHVTASEFDQDTSDNTWVETTSLDSAASDHSVSRIHLPAGGLVYDPMSRRIYASVSGTAGRRGNSITPIDPHAGAVGNPVWVGSEPGKLGLSGDGRTLYVMLHGAAAVRRFDLQTQRPGLQFWLGNDERDGPYYASDIEVLPDNPDAVAVARRKWGGSPAHEGVAVYENGVKRPQETPDFSGPHDLEFSASSTRLHGVSSSALYRMAVDAAGVTVDGMSGLGARGVEWSDGLLYLSSGRVVDPETMTTVGTYPGVSGLSLVAPDPANGRVYFLTQPASSSPCRLLAFGQRDFKLLGSVDIPDISGTPDSLIRWGEDGLAFHTTGGEVGQVLLIRTPLVPAPRPSALSAIPVVGAPRIALSWKDNTGNEIGFRVERREGIGAYRDIRVLPPDTTSWVDSTVAPGRNYTYRIRAQFASGFSPYTNEASVSVVVPPPPAAPSSLSAAALHSTRVRLDWRDNSTDETSFRVERREGEGVFRDIRALPAGTTTFTDVNLAPGIRYTYRVRAYGVGGFSGYTSQVTLTTPAQQGYPADATHQGPPAGHGP